MDIYIIDTNLIFSAALNIDSGIGRFVLRTKEYDVDLYAPLYLKKEITQHTQRIVQASKLSEEEVKTALDKLFQAIVFINDEMIPFKEYVKAMRLVRNIDPDDVSFVALASYMDKTLWTGDQRLYRGLKSMGFEKVVTFEDIKRIYKI